MMVFDDRSPSLCRLFGGPRFGVDMCACEAIPGWFRFLISPGRVPAWRFSLSDEELGEGVCDDDSSSRMDMIGGGAMFNPYIEGGDGVERDGKQNAGIH